MKKIFFLILLVCAFISGSALAIPPIPEIPPFPTIISNGNTYHIDKDNGSDSNDGSASYPWSTIQHGINQLTAGDTLIIHEASFPYDLPSNGSVLKIDKAGTIDNWITIQGAESEKVILRTVDQMADSYEGLHLGINAKYIFIKNLLINGPGRNHIVVESGSNNLAFNNIEIDCESNNTNYSGIWISGGVNNVWFKDLDIHHCGYSKTNPTDCSGVCLKDPSISEVTFLNVTVRDNKGDGIGTGSDPATPAGSVYCDGCTASNNMGDGFDITSSTQVVGLYHNIVNLF